MYQRYIVCSNWRESEEDLRGSGKSGPFYVTFLEQNHQLNHLPPADFYKMCLWASSEFRRYYTEKTSSVSLTVFLNNPLGNFPHTHTYIHTDFLILLLWSPALSYRTINIYIWLLTVGSQFSLTYCEKLVTSFHSAHTFIIQCYAWYQIY